MAQAGPRKPDEQIIGMIRGHDAGMAMAEVSRRHGLSPATFDKLKAEWSCPLPGGRGL